MNSAQTASKYKNIDIVVENYEINDFYSNFPKIIKFINIEK